MGTDDKLGDDCVPGLKSAFDSLDMNFGVGLYNLGLETSLPGFRADLMLQGFTINSSARNIADGNFTFGTSLSVGVASDFPLVPDASISAQATSLYNIRNYNVYFQGNNLDYGMNLSTDLMSAKIGTGFVSLGVTMDPSIFLCKDDQ